MLIEFSVENFLSIKDKVTLSLEATSDKTLPVNSLKKNNKTRLLKSIAIYGANSSGKSNMLSAIDFVSNLVNKSTKPQIDKLEITPFLLDEKYAKKPSKFEIKFIVKNIKYAYSFSCTNEKIIDEKLEYWPNGKKALVFERKNTTNYIFKTNKKQKKDLTIKTIPTALYLSVATQFGLNEIKIPFNFIRKIISKYNFQHWFDVTSLKIAKDKNLKNKIINFLESTDFGGIKDIKSKKSKKIDVKINHKNGIFNVEAIEEKEMIVPEFTHLTTSGKSINFGTSQESLGTQKTFSLLGAIFTALKEGRIVIIDEFDSSLHPDIAKSLIKLFNNKNNKNAQIIFTTHNTNLLDKELFRRDQIYICSKKPNQHTTLDSLIDYNLRKDANYEKAYLDGRLGGLPIIDETVFN